MTNKAAKACSNGSSTQTKNFKKFEFKRRLHKRVVLHVATPVVALPVATPTVAMEAVAVVAVVEAVPVMKSEMTTEDYQLAVDTYKPKKYFHNWLMVHLAATTFGKQVTKFTSPIKSTCIWLSSTHKLGDLFGMKYPITDKLKFYADYGIGIANVLEYTPMGVAFQSKRQLQLYSNDDISYWVKNQSDDVILPSQPFDQCSNAWSAWW